MPQYTVLYIVQCSGIKIVRQILFLREQKFIYPAAIILQEMVINIITRQFDNSKNTEHLPLAALSMAAFA